MMTPAPAESAATDRVADLVDSLLRQRGLAPVAASQPLRDAGLKSMDVFNLMLAIEGAFDIMIPDSDMTPDNFRSIASIQALVAKLT
ncbi:MAG: phosphopantetheine-binding protein [Caulobacteraceae bacterium]